MLWRGRHVVPRWPSRISPLQRLSTDVLRTLEIPDQGGIGQIRVLERRSHSAVAPPVVIIGGTSQTLLSWLAHLRPLSERRDVYVIEARGQGLSPLSLQNASMPILVQDVASVLRALGFSAGSVDLAGFSFGGRIALGLAAHHPELIRRLSLTGVSARRSAKGRLALNIWRQCLAKGDLEAMLWNSVVVSYGPDFLERHEGRFEGWVSAAVEANSVDRVQAVLEQTHIDNEDDPWHLCNLAPLVTAPTQLIVGEFDELAPPDQVRALATQGGWDEVSVVPGAGHMVPIEQPRNWRDHLQRWLDG